MRTEKLISKGSPPFSSHTQFQRKEYVVSTSKLFVREAEKELHKARTDAQDYLLSVLNRADSKPSLVQAVHMIKHVEYGIEDLAVVLASQMRLSAQKFDRVEALQYRRFFVGGIGIGLIPSDGGRFTWFVRGAWNTKHVAPPRGKKFCAEMRIMHAARKPNIGCQHILGTYTAGVPREEDMITLGRSVQGLLRVCEECRKQVRGKHASLFIPESMFISYNPETRERSKDLLEAILRKNGDACEHHHHHQ